MILVVLRPFLSVLEYFRKKLSPWKSIDDHVPVASVLSIGYTVGVYQGENLADSQRWTIGQKKYHNFWLRWS
mgnify:CR=1 FL=1